MITNRYMFLIYLLALALPCSAQWSDSFDDGDFKKEPAWKGDTANFEVNPTGQLHLKAPAINGKSTLVTNSLVSTYAEWRFWLEFDFNPSSTNYAKIYLMTNNANLDSALNGYYLKVGGASDNFSLYSQTGLTGKLIWNGRAGMLNSSVNKVSLKITRNNKGEWLVYADTTGEINYSLLGSAVDSSFWSSRYFGIQCAYSSSRSTKFLFDNFVITGKTSADTIPPKVNGYSAIDDSVVEITFNEAIKLEELTNPVNYQLQSGFSVLRFVAGNKSVQLYISKSVPCSDVLFINVSGMKDLTGNLMKDSVLNMSYCPGEEFNVVITEIMADPDPPVKLPNAEYLELYNRSNATLNLENWSLQIGTDVKHIPSVDLPKDEFLLFCTKGGCSAFSTKRCLDILSSYELNNSGEYIGIRNAKNKLIHWINYSDSWYNDDLKKSGGWSLEMIDTANPCLGEINWTASNNPEGGSPGEHNSVAGTVSDNIPFDYEKMYIPNDSTVRIYFNKPVEDNFSKSLFEVDNSKGFPLKISFDDSEYRYIDIVYPTAFNTSVNYNLSVSANLESCFGNPLGRTISLPFKIPEKVEKGDIILNEILFNALPGRQEFVEFYNKSDKFIRSSDVRFTYHSSGGKYENVYSLGSYSFLIPPKSFEVLTQKKVEFSRNYSVPILQCLTEAVSLPAFSNEEGCIALMTPGLEILDEFCYSEKMHMPELAGNSGVSLERMGYERATNDPANWHSAASTSDFATPGAKNSQFLDEGSTNSEISLESEIFSPNNDGYKDVETIRYKLDQPGYVANIMIFDALGRRVRLLANNKPIGTEGSFIWDGIEDNGRMAVTGIYLVYTELHHNSGTVKKFRNTCVLGGEKI